MRCYPLIDMDASGLNKQPMFMATGEQIIRNRTKFYLTEERPGHYRLRARDAHRMLDYLLYNIHCPKCGKAMQFDDIHIAEHILARYTCSSCNG